MNTLVLVLATFVLSPANSGGLSPAISTGDARTDWQTLAPTAESVAFDDLPAPNIRPSWKKIGVKLLQRVAWDPECSAEYVRRKAGVLAVRDGADGTWLVDEEKFSPAWKAALAEAEVDAAAARYCRALAQEALAQRERDHKVWIEGRRANWLFDAMDLEGENLDTLRLEFVCYAKRLEQILGKAPKDLPLAVAKPTKAPDRGKLRPLAGRDDVVKKSCSLFSKVALSDEVTFAAGTGDASLVIAPKTPCADPWPGGQATLRLYIPDEKGNYLPYAFRIDLSNVSTNRAPDPATFVIERWGKGVYKGYADPTTWRLRAVRLGTFGPKYPDVTPSFRYARDAKTGRWTLTLAFKWLDLYGFWPSTRTGVSDRWFVSLDALPGVKPVAAQISWAPGREANFAKIAEHLSLYEVTQRYKREKLRSSDFYDFSCSDRLYGFLKTEKPTFNRLDAESDKIFRERVVQPMLDANAKLAETVFVQDSTERPKKFAQLSDARKRQTWKSLGRLFDFGERVSAARRDYILTRADGQLPPVPEKKQAAAEEEPEAPAAGPDVEGDDGELMLDDNLEI